MACICRRRKAASGAAANDNSAAAKQAAEPPQTLASLQSKLATVKQAIDDCVARVEEEKSRQLTLQEQEKSKGSAGAGDEDDLEAFMASNEAARIVSSVGVRLCDNLIDVASFIAVSLTAVVYNLPALAV